MTTEGFQLTDSTDVEIRQYRPISRLAVAAALLGLLSGLALLATLLWLVPALGVVAAVAALRSAPVRQGAVGGRRLAVAGLLLSIFFLSLASARWTTSRQQIYFEARQVAQRWLQLISNGNLNAAHQVTLSPYRRQISGFGLEQVYQSNTELLEGKREFFDKPVARQLVAWGKAARWRFLRNVEQTVDGRSCYVVLQYRLQGPGRGPLLAEILLQRYAAWQEEPAMWQVIGIAPAAD